MWPTEPPARTPKLRSVRRYSGDGAAVPGRRAASSCAIALCVLHLALDLTQQRLSSPAPRAPAARTSAPAAPIVTIALAPLGVDDVAAIARHQPERPAEHRPPGGRQPLRHQPRRRGSARRCAATARSAPTRAAHRRTSRLRRVPRAAGAVRSGRRSTDCRACDQRVPRPVRPFPNDVTGPPRGVPRFRCGPRTRRAPPAADTRATAAARRRRTSGTRTGRARPASARC